MSQAMDNLNRIAYGPGFALEAYASSANLSIAERAIFQALGPRIAGKRLLDIGVGGGRTTAFMLELSRDYTAIDYCEGFVDVVKAKFGLDSVYCCDVRDMSRFADEAFDFVMFSFNGLDYVSHEGRLKSLAEINRVLRRDGLFVFSSHNRNRPNGRPRPRLLIDGEAIAAGRWLKSKLKTALLSPRHWLMRRYEVETSEYAIVNDDGLHYSLLTYYITLRKQIEQLESLQFTIEGIYNVAGRYAEDDDQSPWLYYVASKRSETSSTDRAPMRRRTGIIRWIDK
jgi:SAM-dependent methyltransferase